MDLRLFNKSPHIAPMLVQLYESHKLYSLANDKRPLARVELTGAVANLLDADLSAHEKELLTDVLVTLTRQAEKDLRQALADRLCSIDNAPLRLILQLANEEIEIAAPVLRKSPVLNDLDLIYIIRSQGSKYWQAVADRENLSAQVIDILADTKDETTAIVLSENERITLTQHAIGVLTRMATNSDAIAKPLLMRREVPPSVARVLYSYVGEEIKAYIRSRHREINDRAVNALNSIIIDFVDGARSEFLPTDSMLAEARKLAELGMLNLQTMLEKLQSGNLPEFIAMFAQYTGLTALRIHDFMKQSCPKGLAIACRAFGIQKADFSRIYLMSHRMRTKERIVNHKDMLEILMYFDRVKPAIAQRVVARESSRRTSH